MLILIHKVPFISGYTNNQMHWPNSLIGKFSALRNTVALNIREIKDEINNLK